MMLGDKFKNNFANKFVKKTEIEIPEQLPSPKENDSNKSPVESVALTFANDRLIKY